MKPRGPEEKAEELKLGDEVEDESVNGISSFGKINPKSVGSPISAKHLGFLIGPQFVPAEQGRESYADVFSPKVYIK